MNERQIGMGLYDLGDQVGECGYGVVHPHVLEDLISSERAEQARGPTLERAPWAKSEARLRRPNGLHDGIDHFEREPASVLDRPAILIGPLVTGILEELVDQIPMRTVDLDAIESCTKHGVARCLRVCLNILLDFCTSSVSSSHEST